MNKSVSELDQKTKIRLIAKAYRSDILEKDLKIVYDQNNQLQFGFNPLCDFNDLMPILNKEELTVMIKGDELGNQSYYYIIMPLPHQTIRSKSLLDSEYRRIACDALIIKAYGDNVSEKDL